jgi:hypothetical protein
MLRRTIKLGKMIAEWRIVVEGLAPLIRPAVDAAVRPSREK